jgi:hypothetical protein
LVLTALTLGAMLGANAAAQPVAGPSAIPPYTLATFTGAAPAGATAPDDLAIAADGKDLWVGYGNGVDTTGASGSSNLVEYDVNSGKVLQNVSIKGHLDGLKIDPKTNDIWATENEDGNPTLAVVNHKTGKFKISAFAPTLLTGGMDDLAFSGKDSKDVFIAASSQTAASSPVIVRLAGSLKKKNTVVTSTQVGNPAHVFNVVTGMDETTDTIGDPDSMTLDPAGELVLDDRSVEGDGFKSLYIVRLSSATHPLLRVPLTLASAQVEVNDTIFTTSTAGSVYITDTTANVIYTLTKSYFPPNEVYTAANTVGDVGLVDLNTGIVTPVVTGFAGVHGLAFAPTSVAIAPSLDR